MFGRAPFALSTLALATFLATPLGAIADEKIYDPLDPRHKGYAEHLADIAKFKRLRPLRAHYAALHALAVNPRGSEALFALGETWRDHRDLFYREAYRRHPDRSQIAAAVKDVLVRLPEVRTYGTAERLEAFYVGRSVYDARRAADTSVDVGAEIGPDQLIVQGLDADGNLVPIDPDYRTSGGLEVRPGATKGAPDRIFGATPSMHATLHVRDRKSGLEVKLETHVLGPVAAIEVQKSRHQGKEVLGPGDLLHMRTQLYDAAGNSLWKSRLVWLAATPKGEPLTRLLSRGYSWMHFDVSYEAHVNTLRSAADEAYEGEIAIAVIEPVSGTRTGLTVSISRDGAKTQRGPAGLVWHYDSDKAREAAKRDGTPLFLYYHATW